MKVIVEGCEDTLRRGVVLDRAEPATAQRFGERVRAPACACEPVLVVVERAPVMDIEEVEPEGLRRGLLQRIPNKDHVAVGLRHLRATKTHRRHVHPVTNESRFHTVRGLALRGLALVMRINEIASTAVNVDGKTEVAGGHRGTFEVPPGTSTAKGTWPGRSVGHPAPEGEVEGRPPARSEERRVGKGGRAGGAPAQCKQRRT